MNAKIIRCNYIELLEPSTLIQFEAEQKITFFPQSNL